MEKDFWEKITYIEKEIKDAGYDPLAQLYGYIRTNDARYITRQGNARQMITELDMSLLTDYVLQLQ